MKLHKSRLDLIDRATFFAALSRMEGTRSESLVNLLSCCCRAGTLDEGSDFYICATQSISELEEGRVSRDTMLIKVN